MSAPVIASPTTGLTTPASSVYVQGTCDVSGPTQVNVYVGAAIVAIAVPTAGSWAVLTPLSAGVNSITAKSVTGGVESDASSAVSVTYSSAARLDAAVYSRLAGYAGLVDLVNDRIYPDKMPQPPTYPAVSFAKLSTVVHSTFGRTNEVMQSRFEVVAWSDDFDEAQNVKIQIFDALHNYDGTIGSIVILDIVMLGQDDVDAWDPEVEVFRISSDYMITHQEE